MAVIDVGLPFTAHPLHAFHQVALVVHFQTLGVQAYLHLLPDEPGGDGVGPSGRLDGAPLAHPGLVVDVLRHRSWGQALQKWAFLLQFPLHQAVAPLNHLPDETVVGLGGIEVPAAPQHQSLVQSVLQPVMSLLGHAILVGFPGIDQRGLEPVVLQELGVVVVEGPAAAALYLMGEGRAVVGAYDLGRAAQFPERVLESLLQGHKGLAGNHLGVAPA